MDWTNIKKRTRDIFSRMKKQKQDPFHEHYQHLIRNINETYDIAQNILNKWRKTCLQKASPNAHDPDDYVKPAITLVQLVQRLKVQDVTLLLYKAVIQAIKDFSKANNIELHKGALHTNYAITYFERGLYSQGIAWLHAAAEEDIRTYGISDIYKSYALSETGLLGQWLDIQLKKLPPFAISFLNTQLVKNYNLEDVKKFCLWLAVHGDMRFISSVVEFDSVKGMNDPHSHSMRFNCLRDLSAFFEVLWKRLGSNHNDANVVNAFGQQQTLAGLICHMHFTERKKQRRGDPSLNVHKTSGVLWNSIVSSVSLLDAIDSEIDSCGSSSLNDLWNNLSTSTFSSDPVADLISKRFLLAYRIRNQTAHTYMPLAPDFVTNYATFFEWLVQANLYLYFWLRETNQVATP